jgi:hypothetical protein
MKLKCILLSIMLSIAPLTSSCAENAVEIKDKKIVDLIGGLSPEYVSPANVGFYLKVFSHQDNGECFDNTCPKSTLLFLTSTFDEYPEQRLFEVNVSGSLKHLNIIAMPSKEADSYSINVYSMSVLKAEVCSGYVIHLDSIISVVCK